MRLSCKINLRDCKYEFSLDDWNKILKNQLVVA